jgi:hypothetical protein
MRKNKESNEDGPGVIETQQELDKRPRRVLWREKVSFRLAALDNLALTFNSLEKSEIPGNSFSFEGSKT